MSSVPRTRAWRFSSARSGSGPANGSASTASNASTAGSIGSSRKSMPRDSASAARVGARLLRPVARRHRDAVHAVGAERLDGERGRERRVDPAGEADHDLAEAVLLDVVAQAELERLAHLLEVVERRVGRRLAGVDASSITASAARALLREARRRTSRGAPAAGRRRGRRRAAPPRSRARARHLALVVEHDRVAVEDQLVLAADRVAERDEAAVVAGAHASISSRSRCLADVERRGRDVRDSCAPASARSVRAGPGCQMSSQIVGPTTSSPKRSSTRSARARSSGPRRRRRSSAGSACGRRPDLAVGEDVAGVVEVGVEVRRADERGDALRLAASAAEAAPAARRNAGPQQQILGRVAGDGELGEETRSAPARACLPSRVGDPGRVAVEVADDGVHLCEREPHASEGSQVFARSGRKLRQRAGGSRSGRSRRPRPPGDRSSTSSCSAWR